MDISISNVRYVRDNKQLICSIGGTFLTLPDYMLLSDIEYFINEKITGLFMQSLNMMQAKQEIEKQTPIQKAIKHYEDLGWDMSKLNVP